MTYATNGLKFDRLLGLTLLDASIVTADALAVGESPPARAWPAIGVSVFCLTREAAPARTGSRPRPENRLTSGRRFDDVRRAIGAISKGVRHGAGP